MKKILFVFALAFLVLSSFVLAAPELSVEKVDKGSVIIPELGNPASYDLIITNNGNADSFKIYTLVGVSIEPKDSFQLPEGKTTISIKAQPSENILASRNGLLSFEYQLKGESSGIFKDNLFIEIVKLADAVELSAEPLTPSDSEAVVILKNKEDLALDDLVVKIDSPFFSKTETVSLKPLEEKKISVPINKEGVEKIEAGPYIVKAEISVNDKKSNVEGLIDFLEKEGISVDEKTEGFILRKTVSTKTNVGNTVVTAEIEVEKDFISRLFTTVSPEQTSVVRKGGSVTYIWEKEIGPGESLVAETTTNYTVPFILVLIIILAGVLTQIYSMKAVGVKKNVSFVRTKGGEFALKVILKVKAKKAVDKITLTDSLPKMANLYEQFGKKPDKIDKQAKKLQWNVGSLSRGEERVYSYIIYSKINVVGRFELPSAMATFEKEGKFQEVLSNRAFFAAEKD